jgi:hypothetical protein
MIGMTISHYPILEKLEGVQRRRTTAKQIEKKSGLYPMRDRPQALGALLPRFEKEEI